MKFKQQDKRRVVDSWEFWGSLENKKGMDFIHACAESFAIDLKRYAKTLNNIEVVTGAWDKPTSTVSFEIAPVSFLFEIRVIEFKNGTFDAIISIHVWSDIRGALNRIHETVKVEEKYNIPLNEAEIKKLFTSMYKDLYNIVKNKLIQNSELKSLISGIDLPML